MSYVCKIWCLLTICILSFQSVSALEQEDQEAIQQIIKGYADAWNQQGGKGFGAVSYTHLRAHETL